MPPPNLPTSGTKMKCVIAYNYMRITLPIMKDGGCNLTFAKVTNPNITKAVITTYYLATNLNWLQCKGANQINPIYLAIPWILQSLQRLFHCWIIRPQGSAFNQIYKLEMKNNRNYSTKSKVILHSYGRSSTLQENVVFCGEKKKRKLIYKNEQIKWQFIQFERVERHHIGNWSPQEGRQ